MAYFDALTDQVNRANGMIPQQNQFLSGNPSTDNQAQTRWMNPDSDWMSHSTDWTSPEIQSTKQQPQNSNPVATGTVLGQIQAGNYAPTVGWDTGKLNDPNKNDPKYNWLRAVQNVGGNQDLNQVVDFYNRNYGSALGNARYLGGDKVDFGGGVGPVDVLFDQEGARSNLWAPINSNSQFTGPGGSPIQNAMSSMFTNQNSQMQQNQMMDLIWRMMQGRRQTMANQDVNPMGGFVPPDSNIYLGSPTQPFPVPPITSLFANNSPAFTGIA